MRVGVAGALVAVDARTAAAETDGREYEPMATLPGGTISSVTFLRQTSTTGPRDLSESLAVLRANVLARSGQLALIPVDLSLPLAEWTAYRDDALASPAASAHALRSSGFGDVTYRPAVAFVSPRGAGNDWALAFAAYVTMKTGDYDEARIVNAGENRWTFKPEIAASYRLLGPATIDLVVNLPVHTENDRFVTLDGAGSPVTRAMNEGPGFGVEGHFTLDWSATFSSGFSYYLAETHSLALAGGTPLPPSVGAAHTLHTVRLTSGIRLDGETLVSLQLSSDFAQSGGASEGRFFGARISHDFF